MCSLGSSGMIKLFLKGKFSTAAGLGFLNHFKNVNCAQKWKVGKGNLILSDVNLECVL
jgi:hypothetical protein